MTESSCVEFHQSIESKYEQDSKQRAYLTVDFAGLSCHTGKDKAWATSNAKRIHGAIAR